MEEVFLPIVIVGMLFIGMPWVILHYITKWKQSPAMTGEDEQLLDDLHGTARRLEERLQTIERIVAADNPDFRPDTRAERIDHRPEMNPGERAMRGRRDDLGDYDYSRRN